MTRGSRSKGWSQRTRPASQRLYNYALIVGLAAGLSSCESSIDIPVAEADRSVSGDVRSVTRIRHYPAVASRALLWWADLPADLPIERGVTLYRVEYWTTDTRGERTHASGLVAVPRNSASKGIVSYLHPTRTDRQNVPSKPSRDGLLAAVVFGGHGYLVVAPDYLGLGTSPGNHPYLHAATEATATIDLLRAARQIVEHQGHVWPARVFLTGFSQGGHAALAVQRALEAEPVEGLRIIASAPIAGVYNLSGIQFPRALEGASESHAAYLGYVTASYARIYGQPLSSVIREPYARRFEELFGGSMPISDISVELPVDPKKMFHADYLIGMQTGEKSWLKQALTANDVHDWSPQAAVRFYYGAADLDSPLEDTQFTAEQMQLRGADVSIINVGDGDHNEVVFASIPKIRAWFDELAQRATQ